MKKKYFFITFLLLFTSVLYSQNWNQYFDGLDTSTSNSVIINIDTSATNIWQIGIPQKVIFDSASTYPNALVTDTVNNYPINNTSKFTFKIVPWTTWGLLAIQWKQKIDFDFKKDGGIIEYSIDSGTTWTNVANDPHVWNFIGYQSNNLDTLFTGDMGFTGTDSSWKDVWLCFDMTWLNQSTNEFYFRYTLISDSINNNKEGWMIDNMLVHISIAHPVKENNYDNYINVFPNPAKDRVNIVIQGKQEEHIIELMQLVNSSGNLIEEWKNIPTKYWFDVNNYPKGIYYLKVKTNLDSDVIQIQIE